MSFAPEPPLTLSAAGDSLLPDRSASRISCWAASSLLHTRVALLVQRPSGSTHAAAGFRTLPSGLPAIPAAPALPAIAAAPAAPSAPEPEPLPSPAGSPTRPADACFRPVSRRCLRCSCAADRSTDFASARCRRAPRSACSSAASSGVHAARSSNKAAPSPLLLSLPAALRVSRSLSPFPSETAMDEDVEATPAAVNLAAAWPRTLLAPLAPPRTRGGLALLQLRVPGPALRLPGRDRGIFAGVM